MNVFDRDSQAMIDAREFGGMVEVWGRFISAVEELVDSYNAGERGVKYPARLIKEESGTMVSVRCEKGQSRNDPFANVFVTARAKMESRKVTIACTISRWLQTGPTHPRLDSERKLSFVLDPDGSSLRMGSQVLSPYAAAEVLLELALLRN